MAISNIKATFPYNIKTVWNIVTSLENYSWRSDISKIDIISDSKFIEYTNDGYATTFTVTVNEPYKRWEFDMENDKMKGHWVGIFSYENEHTTIYFMEDVVAKKFYMKPFVKSYLKKQQAQYVADLKKILP
jgi:hypothetical protein